MEDQNLYPIVSKYTRRKRKATKIYGGRTVTSFEIKETEIQEIIQLSKLQGGSKYRQEEIYKLLDRVVARKDSAKPEVPDMPEKIIICPYCMTENPLVQYQCVATCKKCGSPVFRSI
jgi:uncharacterized CHY-type Zn-finger protein